MNEYLIVRCNGCGQTWAMDFQPDPCTCELTDSSPMPDTDLWEIEADDFRQAVLTATSDL